MLTVIVALFYKIRSFFHCVCLFVIVAHTAYLLLVLLLLVQLRHGLILRGHLVLNGRFSVTVVSIFSKNLDFLRGDFKMNNKVAGIQKPFKPAGRGCCARATDARPRPCAGSAPCPERKITVSIDNSRFPVKFCIIL